MNLLKSIAASGFLLLLFSLTGCATYEPAPVAADAHPEKYREVYLMDLKGDPRAVTPRVVARLKEAGFHVTEVHYDPPRDEKVSDSLKKIDELAESEGGQEPAVICTIACASIYDEIYWRWWSFENIDIEFRDAETGKMVFRTFKNNFDTPVPENTELDRRFVQIENAFFPGQRNPFIAKK